MFSSDREWINGSERVEDAAVEAFFCVRTDFFHGNDKRFMEERHVHTVHLDPPSIFGASDGHVASLRLVGHEAELAVYYKRVLATVAQYAKPLRSAQAHFWLKLELQWQGKSILFCWTDWWDQMLRFLDWAASAEDGQDWYDVDQGWELELVRRGSAFHVRAGDAEDEEWANVTLDRDQLLESIRGLKERMASSLAALEAALGENYWISTRWYP